MGRTDWVRSMMWDDHPSDDVHLLNYEPKTELASNTVLRGVAAVRDSRPSQLPRLYDVVAPDALDDLFRVTDDGVGLSSVAVWFRYQGFLVTVTRRHVILREDH